MKTKTAFFALLNDNAQYLTRESSVVVRNGSASVTTPNLPNFWISSHRSEATAAAASAKYQSWLVEWKLNREAAEAPAVKDPLEGADMRVRYPDVKPAPAAGKPVNVQTLDAAIEHLERMKSLNGGQLSMSETFTLAAFEQLFSALTDQQKQAETAERFPETERMACINSAHITRRNLVSLNMADDWWILSTGFGFVVRFEAAVRTWEEQDDSSILHPFKRAGLDDTFATLCVEMRDAGFQVIHLDADGPIVEGLHVYEH